MEEQRLWMVTYKGEEKSCVYVDEDITFYLQDYMPPALLKVGITPHRGKAFCKVTEADKFRPMIILNLKP